jgi:nitroreductase
MPNIPPDAVLDALSWRYATKKFDPTKKIPAATWSSLEKAAILAPSSFGLQPWKFVVVTDPAVRVRLRPAAYNQAQITDCSHLVVFCRRTPMTAHDVERHLDRVVEVRRVARDSLTGYRDSMLGTVNGQTPQEMDVWSGHQTFIALGVFLASAAMMGIDSCPMGGFEGPKFDEILGLKDKGYASTVLAAAGYRAADDPTSKHPKVRWDVEDAVIRV